MHLSGFVISQPINLDFLLWLQIRVIFKSEFSQRLIKGQKFCYGFILKCDAFKIFAPNWQLPESEWTAENLLEKVLLEKQG